MRTLLLVPTALCGLLFAAPFAKAEQSAAEIGKPAPEFSLKGSDGKTHSLAEVKGKTVVLEWTNPECPFVQKFYHSGEMQKLQKEAADKKVVWYRVNSNAPGKQGSQTPEELAAYEKANHVAATVSLADPKGVAGREYGARTTPHIFIIDPKGILIYEGGIDNIPSTEVADIAKAKNYVRATLDESLAGKPVSIPTSKPYGCSVKYAK